MKAIYNKEFLRRFGEKVHAVYGAFNIEGFVAAAMGEIWDELALKARMRRITETLRTISTDSLRRGAGRVICNIAKDNPSIVLETARHWKGECPL